ncbi:hypothetical protein LY90DRAFT_667102, partial [Neocallimastix californiae]
MNNLFKGNIIICSRCIAATLLDDDLLVQRSALELLVSYLPVNYKPFSNEDLEIVVSSAITKMLLVKEEFQKPYKILLSLLDDSRIGLIIVDELFIDILILVYYHHNNSNIGDELINTVNMFLSMIEPYIIWSNVFHNLEKHHPKDENDNKEIYQLFEFLLSFIKITDEEAEIIHLPFCFYLMFKQLNEIDDYEKYKDNITIYMKLILTILKRISKNSFRFTESKINEIKTTPVGVYITSNKFNEFSFIDDYYKMQMSNIIDSYNNRLSGNNAIKLSNENLSLDNPEYISSIVENATIDHCSYVAYCCIKKSLLLIYSIYEKFTVKCIFNKNTFDELELACQTCEYDENSKYIMNEKSFKSQNFDSWKLELYGYFYFLIYDMAESTINPYKLEFVPIEYDYIFKFKNQENEMAVYHSYDTYGKKFMVNSFQIINSSLLLLFDVISKKNILWNYLSDKCVSYHIQTVKLILELCKYLPSTYIIEKLFSAYMNLSSNKQQNYNKFGVFWKNAETIINPATMFSQPLFILFDTLFSNNPLEKQVGEQWFKNYVKDVCICFDPLLQILHNSVISRNKEELIYESSKIINYKYIKEINYDQIIYAFDCILSLINNLNTSIMKKLWKTPLKVDYLLSKCERLFKDYDCDVTNITYGEFITLTCLIFIQSETPSYFSEDCKTKNESIQLQSCKLLLIILSFIPREKQNLNSRISITQEIVLKKLLFCIFNEKFKYSNSFIKNFKFN